MRWTNGCSEPALVLWVGLAVGLTLGGGIARGEQQEKKQTERGPAVVVEAGKAGREVRVLEADGITIQVVPAAEEPSAGDRPPATSQTETEAEASPATPRVVDLEALRAEYEARQKALREQLRSDPAWQASHEEEAVIDLGDVVPPGQLNNFCLSPQGNILACCGTTSAGGPQIRVLSPAGELLSSWKLDMIPQAICVHRDGTIFVGGDGHLAKLSPEGKVLAMVDSPALQEAQKQEQQKASPQPGPEEEESKSLLGALIKALTGGGPSQEETARQRAEYMRQRARSITGIAVTDEDLFVACPMTKGYGYAVWRMDHDFGDAERIVEGLRGCCGQMDIQAHDGELWIPENGRHRVSRYDRQGTQLSSFGRRDRKAADGFGGCCEPKNLRFDSGGDLLAAESGPPVAVKRFSLEGEFRGVVALPVFKTGCVRVTVDVSRDGSKLYVLNIGESKIHVFGDKLARLSAPTHEQVTTIAIPIEGAPATIHTFCLSREGNLLAACGGERISYSRGPKGTEIKTIQEEAGIRVIAPDGQLLASWQLDITPQAINVADDGTIYVGGQGRLAKLDRTGKVLLTVDAPHVAELGPLPALPEADEQAAEESEEERAAKKARITELGKKLREAMTVLQEARTRQVQAAQDDAKSRAEANARYLEAADAYVKVSGELRQLTTNARTLAIQQRAAAMRKRAVTGIAVTGQDVFVACPAAKGYGYDVWRMDRDLAGPKKIVTGLRGCCGQMDIQAQDGQLLVAENSRGRVVRYDRDGTLLGTWGKKDRNDITCFGSCCNPMNLRFGPEGCVYTSEASVGRIKRYSLDGEFLGLVGTVSLVPGCKHVPIAITQDGSRVYMLDITRSYIAVLARRGETRSVP